MSSSNAFNCHIIIILYNSCPQYNGCNFVIYPVLLVYRTIKVWDLAAALDAGSSSGTLCITTLKVRIG